MNERKRSQHTDGGPHRDNVHSSHRPYWKRAHRDWRIWVGVGLMLAAMFIYVMSDDFAWRPRSQQPPPPSASVGQ